MHDFLAAPKMMNMGFHYTRQYSRRSRIKVLGLVDHSTDEWVDWYEKTHEIESLRKMAEAGYDLIEIHFLYGFGLKNESEEIELTKKMVENAHEVGIKVLGYFQFFSIQDELFCVENPWAKRCFQKYEDGTRQEYSYDRSALCFSHEKVRKYYLDGIELGMTYCDLDGIRFDNDYHKGCYCENCERLFHEHLIENYSADVAKRVFGFSDVSNIAMPSAAKRNDPAWLELVKFRQQQRQRMMCLLRDKVKAIKPHAIFGGNPAVTRKFAGDCDNHFYPPDLGETHDLVCGENSLSPEFTGDSIRTQIVIYKFGESAGFSVYPSHHAYDENNMPRWPKTTEECARTLCEALCFGGHTPCTTWGIRMDEDEKSTLYERPCFLKATTSVSDFIHRHANIYEKTRNAAKVGIYINRENRILNAEEAFASLHGAVQVLLKHRIPFRFVVKDGEEALKGLDLLVVPNVQPVSTRQLKILQNFTQDGKLVLTGKSCMYDEFFLRRVKTPRDAFGDNSNVVVLDGTPEAINLDDVEFHGSFVKNIPMPKQEGLFADTLKSLITTDLSVEGGNAIGVDIRSNDQGEHFVHILNFDNDHPVNLEISLPREAAFINCFAPDGLGFKELSISSGKLSVFMLHTYLVVKYSS